MGSAFSPDARWRWPATDNPGYMTGRAAPSRQSQQPPQPSRREKREHQRALIETRGGWSTWFREQSRAGWIQNPTLDSLRTTKEDYYRRVDSPQAQQALSDFATSPTSAAVDVAEQLYLNGQYLNTAGTPGGMERLVSWSFARVSMREMTANLQYHLGRSQNIASNHIQHLNEVSRMESSAGNQNEAGLANNIAHTGASVFSGASQFMIANSLSVITGNADNIGVSRGEVLRWLVANTPEGPQLAAAIGSVGDYAQQVYGQDYANQVNNYFAGGDPTMASAINELAPAASQSVSHSGQYL